MNNNIFSVLVSWIKDRNYFVKKRRMRYAHMIVSGNPVGYYIESIRGMCSLWQKSMLRRTLKKEALGCFIPQLLRARSKYYYEEVYETIDKCLYNMYKYSKEMNFVSNNLTYKEFLKIYNVNFEK